MMLLFKELLLGSAQKHLGYGTVSVAFVGGFDIGFEILDCCIC